MGEIERLVAEANDGSVDEEFLNHLYKGGELLSAGKTLEAKEFLEKAYKLQPKNEKGQNLLGLTYFKLGDYARAAEIYELLVRENPVDPTLRVNLGLVYLKLNELSRAIRELETTVDLAPEHKKAQNYLGLAYAQAGEFARAKDCFVAAGSAQMVEKMEKALKDPSKAPPITSGKPKVKEPEAAPAASARNGEEKKGIEVEIDVEEEESEKPGEVSVNAWTEEGLDGGTEHKAREGEPVPTPEFKSAPPEPAPEAAKPAPEAAAPVASPAPATAPAVAAPPVLTAAMNIKELTAALALPKATGQSPFELSKDVVVARVNGELLVRLDGLLAATGPLTYKPEMKRFRGRSTDKAFGDGERRVVRVSGNGSLVLGARGRTFVAVELDDESAYFQEEMVFGFEESVAYENGRVPSSIAPDMHLVHLRGKGKVLLSVPSPLRTVPVAMDQSCSVPLSVLVGWHGSLTPKVVGVLQEGEATAVIAAVELAGEGYAILAPPKSE